MQTTTIAQTNGHHNGFISQTQPALPEAACSVNLFFEIEGYGKAQATGRGRTAQEAAANLHATMQETRAAFAPPAPVKPRLADLLACGIEKAVSKGDLGRVERLAKAAALVLSGAVEQCAIEGRYTVKSQTCDTVYDVFSNGACQCQDYTRHASPAAEAYWCKHGLAVLMSIRLAE